MLEVRDLNETLRAVVDNIFTSSKRQRRPREDRQNALRITPRNYPETPLCGDRSTIT
jgi:hypothetical protein